MYINIMNHIDYHIIPKTIRADGTITPYRRPPAGDVVKDHAGAEPRRAVRRFRPADRAPQDAGAARRAGPPACAPYPPFCRVPAVPPLPGPPVRGPPAGAAPRAGARASPRAARAPVRPRHPAGPPGAGSGGAVRDGSPGVEGIPPVRKGSGAPPRRRTGAPRRGAACRPIPPPGRPGPPPARRCPARAGIRTVPGSAGIPPYAGPPYRRPARRYGTAPRGAPPYDVGGPAAARPRPPPVRPEPAAVWEGGGARYQRAPRARQRTPEAAPTARQDRHRPWGGARADAYNAAPGARGAPRHAPHDLQAQIPRHIWRGPWHRGAGPHPGVRGQERRRGHRTPHE